MQIGRANKKASKTVLAAAKEMATQRKSQLRAMHDDVNDCIDAVTTGTVTIIDDGINRECGFATECGRDCGKVP